MTLLDCANCAYQTTAALVAIADYCPRCEASPFPIAPEWDERWQWLSVGAMFALPWWPAASCDECDGRTVAVLDCREAGLFTYCLPHFQKALAEQRAASPTHTKEQPMSEEATIIAATGGAR